MNGSRQRVVELIDGVASATADFSNAEVVICPPTVFLMQAAELVKSSSLKVGAQNVNAHSEGAYTGEIAPSMLCDAGCQYVIVGHSERRTLYKETDEEVAAKCVAVIANKMTPIVCVGETLEERENNQMEKVIQRQLQAVLAVIKEIEKCVIAYEPVWAIGTGKTATAQQAQAVHQLIRSRLCDVNNAAAQKIRIVYGGSVKAGNADELFAMPDIDGGLIGGASLIVDEFVAICKAAELKEREN
jgi:triosephosphate isomerase